MEKRWGQRRQDRRLDVEFREAIGIQPGKASLLMHSHNEEHWDLDQILIHGTLEKGGKSLSQKSQPVAAQLRLRHTCHEYWRNMDRF